MGPLHQKSLLSNTSASTHAYFTSCTRKSSLRVARWRRRQLPFSAVTVKGQTLSPPARPDVAGLDPSVPKTRHTVALARWE